MYYEAEFDKFARVRTNGDVNEALETAKNMLVDEYQKAGYCEKDGDFIIGKPYTCLYSGLKVIEVRWKTYKEVRNEEFEKQLERIIKGDEFND